jgi:hypothetical protein
MFPPTFLYTQSWEDPEPDMQVFKLTQQDTVLTLTSGGCNTLNLLIHGAGHVRCLPLPRPSAPLLCIDHTACQACRARGPPGPSASHRPQISAAAPAHPPRPPPAGRLGGLQPRPERPAGAQGGRGPPAGLRGLLADVRRGWAARLWPASCFACGLLLVPALSAAGPRMRGGLAPRGCSLSLLGRAGRC